MMRPGLFVVGGWLPIQKRDTAICAIPLLILSNNIAREYNDGSDTLP
jgi:hypothetical protein